MVSVIIPAYNAENFISKTIESVLSQTYTDWELIIVDDGSTDGTAKLVSDYISSSKTEKIKLLSQKNSGVSVARNKGIDAAKGDFIAFLDADDYWLPNNLFDKYTFLNKNPEADFTFSNFYIGDKDLEILEKGPVGTDIDMLENLLYWKRAVIPGASSNLFLRKKCFDQGLRFDPAFSTAADQDFCFYLVYSFKGKHLNDYTWIYRVHSTSMSRNMQTFEKDHVGVFKKASKHKIFKSFSQKQKCFSVMYITVAGGWWVNGGNKLRSIKFLVLALGHNPLSILKLAQRVRFAK